MSASEVKPHSIVDRVGPTIGFVALGVTGLITAGLILVTAIESDRGPSQDSIATAEQQEDLVSALDRTVSLVSIPVDWEVEASRSSSYPHSVGYRAAPDLSSSGTWILISVAVSEADEGETSEDAVWHVIATLEEATGGHLEDGPLATTHSGLDGYLYEVSGLTGDKTGQELGANIAMFFGSEYTYEVVVQYELPDQADMGDLFRTTVSDLTLVEGTDVL